MPSECILRIQSGKSWTQSSWEVGDGRRRDERSLVGGRTPLRAGRRRAHPRPLPHRAHAGAPRRRASMAVAALRGLRRRARRADRSAGRPDGEGRPEGDLPLRLAGGGRRESLRPHVPGSEPLPGEQRAGAREADQQRAPASRPGRLRRGQERHLLARAHRRRCRSWLRRSAQRIRAHEVVHRGRRRGCPLRGSALVREEVRAPRRQGLVPTSQFVRTLVSARLAADVLDVPTVLVARTDALSATLLTSDVDERDREFTTGERTPEGFFRITPGIEAPIARALAYAPYADVLCARRRPPTSTRRRSSRKPCTLSTPESSSRTTARRRSTGASISTTRRSRRSSTSSRRWATGSSS